jgi:hypothetical protein
MYSSKTIAWVILSAIVLGGLVVAEGAGRDWAGKQPPTEMDGWDLARLEQHLNSRGLQLQFVSTMASTVSTRNAYLSPTPRTFKQTQSLHRVAECIDEWRGVVYCERTDNLRDWSTERNLSAGCSFTRGPFWFFGDPKLLERIRTVLDEIPAN